MTCPDLVVLQPSDSRTAFLPPLAQTCDKVAVMQYQGKEPVFTCGGWALASNDPHKAVCNIVTSAFGRRLGVTAQEQASCSLEALSI